MKNHTTAILASYVTYKELNSHEEYKSPYQILAEFIKYLIYEKKLYSFSIASIKLDIENEFEFNLPNAVIKSALKKIDFVKYNSADNYIVDSEKINVDSLFKKYKATAKDTENNILEQLISYVENKKKYRLNYNEKKELIKSLVAYLLDESNGNQFQKEISCFILESTDNKITEYLNSVREGAILYTGLNYDIREVGSLKKDLTLFLDTEILFDIYGYNGEVFQKLALDLFNLVRDANATTKKIQLKYFEETKKEIDLFFEKAEEIIIGKTLVKDTVAMKAIINGCQNASDVCVKRADFYSELKERYKITLDDRCSYYTENDFKANLEFTFSEDEQKDYDIQLAVRLISHINKLRNNKTYYDYLESGFIFVSDTWKTQECSRKMIELTINESDKEKQLAGYAISMGMITNFLWYKLNKGFGNKDFPENVNSVLKAKIVLANLISQNVSQKFTECKESYQKGEITEQQLTARVLALREKSIKPEEITVENLEDSLNFDDDYIKRFEIELEESRIKSKQDNEEKRNLKSEIKELKEFLQNEKEQKEILSQEKDRIIQENNDKLKENEELKLKQKEKEEELKKYKEKEEKRKKWWKVAKRSFSCMFKYIIIFGIAYWFIKQVSNDTLETLSFLGGVGFFYAFCYEIKKIYHNEFHNQKLP